MLERMIAAGMDLARLNFAHGTIDEHAETVEMIRAASERVGREIGILQDIPGPKLRLGPVEGGMCDLAQGSGLVLTAEAVMGTSERLPVAWQGFSEIVQPGDVAYLADGAIRLRVKEVSDGDVITEVEVGGSVASRQGINLPNVTVSLPAVSGEDLERVDAGVEMGVDVIALSSGSRAGAAVARAVRLRGAADREDREAAGGRRRCRDRRGRRRDHGGPR
jgi:pyruvate kinase